MTGFLPKKSAYRVAVVGATGAVGKTMLEILEERDFPVEEIVPLASSRSAGSEIRFRGNLHIVQELAGFDPAGVDIALFSAGGETSLEHAPVALKPLHDVVPIERVVVSTYQAVSGAGGRAIDELAHQTRDLLSGSDEIEVEILPARIAFNLIPHIDIFLEDGYTKEEHKMMDETRKILEADIAITATTVRVPIFYCHGESVNVTFAGAMDAERARNLLADADGIAVVDDPKGEDYPMPIEVVGTDAVWVGRIRDDRSCPNTLNMWIVADNVRKGAALNAVQIAEMLINQRREQDFSQRT